MKFFCIKNINNNVIGYGNKDKAITENYLKQQMGFGDKNYKIIELTEAESEGQNQLQVMPNEVLAGGQVDKLLTEILEANKKYMDDTGWCSTCWSDNCPHSYKTDLLIYIKNKLGLKCEPA